MTTELVITQVATPISSIETGTYYRSRVFTAETGVNELVMAAQPLLALMTRLAQTDTEPKLAEITENLIHELKTYEARAQQCLYDNETLLLGRYFIVTCLQAIAQTKPWFVSWQASEPLAAYLPPDQSPEQIPTILDRLYIKPQAHLDLLELAYLCLSLSDNQGQWQTHLDPLYQRIRSLRDDVDAPLFLSTSHLQKIVIKPRFSTWLTLILAIVSVSIVYCGFSYLIGMQ